MTETAISNETSINWTNIRIISLNPTELDNWFPNRVINKWPAIILAESRMASVKGRITLLVLSISTIKGIKTPGVLCGTRWANMSLLNLIHPKSINPSQIGNAVVTEITMCLVEVKM